MKSLIRTTGKGDRSPRGSSSVRVDSEKANLVHEGKLRDQAKSKRNQVPHELHRVVFTVVNCT